MGPKNSGVATAWSGVAMATLDPPQMAPLYRNGLYRNVGMHMMNNIRPCSTNTKKNVMVKYINKKRVYINESIQQIIIIGEHSERSSYEHLYTEKLISNSG